MIVAKPNQLSYGQCGMLVLLRIAIGWHFCFAGIAKLMEGNWSAAGYLQASVGPLAPFFRSLADEQLVRISAQWSVELIEIINVANIGGQIILGAFLILGLFTRFSILGCAVMLIMYYLSNPPWPYVASPVNDYTLMQEMVNAKGQFWMGKALAGYEGAYLFVNKNLIELLGLLVLFTFNTGKLVGLDALIYRWRMKRKERYAKPASKKTETQESTKSINQKLEPETKEAR